MSMITNEVRSINRASLGTIQVAVTSALSSFPVPRELCAIIAGYASTNYTGPVERREYTAAPLKESRKAADGVVRCGQVVIGIYSRTPARDLGVLHLSENGQQFMFDEFWTPALAAFSQRWAEKPGVLCQVGDHCATTTEIVPAVNPKLNGAFHPVSSVCATLDPDAQFIFRSGWIREGAGAQQVCLGVEVFGGPAMGLLQTKVKLHPKFNNHCISLSVTREAVAMFAIEYEADDATGLRNYFLEIRGFPSNESITLFQGQITLPAEIDMQWHPPRIALNATSCIVVFRTGQRDIVSAIGYTFGS